MLRKLKNTLIGIVSYLPNTTNRAKRLKTVTRLVEFIKNNFPETKIVVVAQCYNDDEYVDGVDYIKFNRGISAAGARNVLLRHFYESNYEWLMFMDDDCFIRDYYNAYELFSILDSDPNVTPIDLITSVDPSKCGYKKYNIDNRSVVEDNFTFSTPIRTIQFAWLRNLRKYYGEEIYFNETQDVDGRFYAEDFLWVKEVIANGFRVRSCKQWIQDNKGTTYSIIIDDKKDDVRGWHRAILEDTMKYFVKLYDLPEKNCLNVFRKKYDVLNRADNDQFNIPRLTHHELSEVELDYKPRSK